MTKRRLAVALVAIGLLAAPLAVPALAAASSGGSQTTAARGSLQLGKHQLIADYQISRGSLPDYSFAPGGVRPPGRCATRSCGVALEVSVVPVGFGMLQPPSSALATSTFAPRSMKPGGRWQVAAHGTQLLASSPSPQYDGFASAPMRSRSAIGRFRLSGTGAAAKPSLTVHVAIPLGKRSFAVLARRLRRNPTSVAIVTSFGDGTTVINPAAANPGGGCLAHTGCTVGVRVGSNRVLPATPEVQVSNSPASALVESAFSGPPALGSSSSSKGCGSVMTEDGNGLIEASGFADFVPVVGPFLEIATLTGGVYDGAMASQDGSACATAQFTLMNAQLADQEGQIQALQTQLASQQNQIYAAIAAGTNQVRKLTLTNYNNAVAAMTATPGGGPGIVGNAMILLNFWAQNLSAIPSASIAGSSSGTPFTSVAQASAAQSPAFIANLNDLAGSSVVVTKCSTTSCPKSAVVTNSTFALQQLWVSEAQQMQATAQLDVNEQANVVPLFDQYNNAIVNQFQTSLGALQQAFTLEAMVNQLNYEHATGSCTWGQASPCAMIPSFGQVPGTSYTYCASMVNGSCPATTLAAQTAAYNAAQKQLAQVYAWRVEQLVTTALGFIFTDPPVGSQAYPTTTASVTVGATTATSPAIDYAGLVGALLHSDTGIQQTPLTNLPTAVAAGSSWESNGALYQFVGLNDLNGCANGILAANQGPDAGTAPPPANPCPPPIFQTSANTPVDQAVYSGGMLQPYIANGGAPALSGPLQVNLRLCNSSNPQLTWYTPPAANTGNAAGLESGQWYLDCGNWAQIGQSGWTCFQGGGCPSSWSDPASTWTWVESKYFGDSSSYPDVVSHNHTLSDANSNNYVWAYFGSDDHGNGSAPWSDQVTFMNPNMKPVGTWTGAYSASSNQTGTITSYGTYAEMQWPVPGKNKTTAQGVIAIPGLNQANPTGLGFSIPMAFNLQYLNKTSSIFGWQPEQNTTIATTGFTCSGWTCTVADGSQWVFGNIFPSVSSNTGHRMFIELMPAG